MNGEREHIVKFWELPNKLVLDFDGFDGAPEREDLNPVLTYENQEDCLARLKVLEYTPKQVVLEMPESLLKFGLYRYDVWLYQACCRPCDRVKIQFCGTCEITRARASC